MAETTIIMIIMCGGGGGGGWCLGLLDKHRQ